MGKDLDKESAEAWYQANKIAADRIINDLKKQSFEGVMHLYAYTSKSKRVRKCSKVSTISRYCFLTITRELEIPLLVRWYFCCMRAT